MVSSSSDRKPSISNLPINPLFVGIPDPTRGFTLILWASNLFYEAQLVQEAIFTEFGASLIVCRAEFLAADSGDTGHIPATGASLSENRSASTSKE